MITYPEPKEFFPTKPLDVPERPYTWPRKDKTIGRPDDPNARRHDFPVGEQGGHSAYK